MWKSFALEPHGESSEFADECIGLNATIDFRIAKQKQACGE
jgi:hypothetical protein